MSDTNCLILGAAVGLGVADVWVFVESLRRHFNGAVILLVGSRDEGVADYLRSREVRPVFFDSAYWMVCHVQLSRFLRYGELLRPAKPYDRVLMTDVSDVVFQGDPFADLPAGELLCFMEEPGPTIETEASNRRWVQQVFGDEGLRQVGDRPISCSGTTIGTHRAVLEYIDRLASKADPEVLIKYRNFRGHDQGIHNYLLHTGGLSGAAMVPNGRHVLTMGKMRHFGLGGDGLILNAQDRACPIVHQYTYNPLAQDMVRSTYPLPK